MLWRFGAGVLGGWAVIAILLVAIIGGYVCFGLAVSHRMSSVMELGAIASGVAFLGVVFSFTVVRNRLQSHPIMRLVPGARDVATALMRRLALITLIALPPAVAMHALARTNITLRLDVSALLHEVPTANYLSAALYLAHVAVLTAITFGPLKVPHRFAMMPMYFGGVTAVTRGWSWFPLVTCVVLVFGYWFWRRFESQLSLSPPRRDPSAAPRPSALALWWHARQVQRIVRVHAVGGTRARISALLATQSTSPFTVVSIIAATLYLALKPGFMDSIAVLWLMALPIVVLLSMPPSIPLSRIMLLPLGAERARVGDIVAAVWARQIRTRLLTCTSAGLLLHAFFLVARMACVYSVAVFCRDLSCDAFAMEPTRAGDGFVRDGDQRLSAGHRIATPAGAVWLSVGSAVASADRTGHAGPRV